MSAKFKWALLTKKNLFFILLLFDNYKNNRLNLLKYWKYVTTEKYTILS